MKHKCITCGKKAYIALGNSNTRHYCQEHAPSLVNLNDMTKDLDTEEKRLFIKKFYDGAYKMDIYEPHNGLYGWQWIVLRTQVKFDKALDVGCGTGEGMRWAIDKGLDVYGIDFADATKMWKRWGVEDRCKIASALNIPYPDDTFDLVACMDVMEHIPEEDVLDALKEMRRVGNLCYVFAVALTLEKEPVAKKVLTHITIKDADWWIDKFKEAGYGVAALASGKPAIQLDDDHIRAFLTKDC